MNNGFGHGFWLLLIIILICGLHPISVMAQDPGLPDSVVLTGDAFVPYNPGVENYYDLRLSCVTDDSILFLNVPLEWSGDGWQIYPLEFLWQNTFGLWENNVYYPGIGSNSLSLSIGVGLGHNSPPLFTGYQRELGIIIRFGISPFALPQTVFIDTTTNPVSGKIEMANIDITFRPKFRGISFRYEVPGLAIEDNHGSPNGFALKSCYPNPFNSSTMIELELEKAADCRLIIYDILGREIACLIDGELGSGRHSIIWNGMAKYGAEAVSGLYFAKITVNGVSETQKIELIR
jgi:hypothetical protein